MKEVREVLVNQEEVVVARDCADLWKVRVDILTLLPQLRSVGEKVQSILCGKPPPGVVPAPRGLIGAVSWNLYQDRIQSASLIDYQVGGGGTDRTKRALFDLGGDILVSLYRVATASDLDSVYADIGQIVDRMQVQEKLMELVIEDTHKYVRKVNETTLAFNNIRKRLTP